jgi:hypothetical protein
MASTLSKYVDMDNVPKKYGVSTLRERRMAMQPLILTLNIGQSGLGIW